MDSGLTLVQSQGYDDSHFALAFRRLVRRASYIAAPLSGGKVPNGIRSGCTRGEVLTNKHDMEVASVWSVGHPVSP